LRNEKSKYLNAIKRRNVLITQKKNLQKENKLIENKLKIIEQENKKLKFEQEIDRQTIEEYKRIIFH